MAYCMFDSEHHRNANYETRSAIYFTGIGLFAYLLKVAFYAIAAHFLTKGLYADFVIGVKILWFAATVLLMGRAFAAKRFLSYYLGSEDVTNSQHYIIWCNRFLSGISTLFLGLLLLCLLLAVIFHLFDWYSLANYHLAIYMLWVAPLTAAFTLDRKSV